MPRQRLEHQFNEFTYITEFDTESNDFDFRIIYPTPKEKPPFLFKYYSINQNSIDAVISNYLFSSHPDQLNDKYDCSGDLINYSEIQKNTVIQRLTEEYKKYTVQNFNEIWESENKWLLLKEYAETERARLFMKFGIISLSQKENDTLLWSYYSQNCGFAVKINTELLPEDFIGPFHVNYSPELTKIEYCENNPPLCIHYQTNVKQDIWQHEDEWRFVTYNPLGQYHPYFARKDVNSRKSFYNKDAVTEIILGYNFFNINEINRSNGFDIISLKPSKGKGINLKKQRRKLLSFIVDNKINCSRIIRSREEYKLFNEPVSIEKLSCNRYKFIPQISE